MAFIGECFISRRLLRSTMRLEKNPMPRSTSFVLTLCALAGAAGCDGGSAAEDSGTSGVETAGATDAAADDSTSTGAATSATSSTSTTDAPTTAPVDDDDSSNDDGPPPPINFDLAQTPDFGDVNSGCSAVDFLFVIDNSGSMLSAQDNLVANFPAFIDGIQATLTDVESYHVGVTTSDAYDDNVLGCQTLGSLVVETGGGNSSNMACGPYTEGFNFITEEDDLASAFTCAARVGTSGDGFERPMAAVELALGDDLAAAGACNEGFLRTDALLVVVVITDEADGPGDPDGAPPNNTSEGTPASWHASVISAKNDIPENAAALVLTNYEGGACPPDFSFDDGANLVEFANLFGENGFVGGICEADYGPIFANATAVIEQACENFVPPG
ncbi:MAG: hypothetical protein AAGA54_01190 [Myxococcota bacterium]